MLARILLTWSFLIAPIYGLHAGTQSNAYGSTELMETDSFEDRFPTSRPHLELMPWSSELESQPTPPPKPPRTFTYQAPKQPRAEKPQIIYVYERKEPPEKSNRILKTIKLKVKVIAQKIKKGMKKVKKYISKGFKATKRKLKNLRH